MDKNVGKKNLKDREGDGSCHQRHLRNIQAPSNELAAHRSAQIQERSEEKED